ncbi:glycosyltransferase [Pectobacteriaceae bacterium C52]|nr:glycosyltransferase [Pectobacteriaceae bacterium C52]
MKIGIVVVWYKPTLEQINNMKNIVGNNQFKICIVDNTPDVDNVFYFNELLANGNNYYIYNGNKGGIAGGFNRGAEKLFEDSDVDYFFTMDQDSSLISDFFLGMYSFCKEKKSEISCPNFYDRNAKVYGSFVLLTPYFYKISTDGTTNFCISSGMCISRRAWELVGPFDESLIIDHVDTAFALKALVFGFIIKVNYDECLNHAIGEREVHKLFGITVKPNHHNYIRKYYIVRNGFYLSFKYFKEAKGYFNLNVLRVMHEFVSVIFYEKDKIRKIKYMLKGLLDAVRGKLGDIK